MAKPDYQRRIEDEARRELDGLAWGQAALGCCEKDCLMATFKDRGKVYGFVFECLNEVNRMDRREKLQYMMDKVYTEVSLPQSIYDMRVIACFR